MSTIKTSTAIAAIASLVLRVSLLVLGLTHNMHWEWVLIWILILDGLWYSSAIDKLKARTTTLERKTGSRFL